MKRKRDSVAADQGEIEVDGEPASKRAAVYPQTVSEMLASVLSGVDSSRAGGL